jgi:hypothetical protein
MEKDQKPGDSVSGMLPLCRRRQRTSHLISRFPFLWPFQSELSEYLSFKGPKRSFIRTVLSCPTGLWSKCDLAELNDTD